MFIVVLYAKQMTLIWCILLFWMDRSTKIVTQKSTN